MNLSRIFRLLCQVAFLSCLTLIGNELSRQLPLPLPGSIIGMLILFLLLERQWLPLAQIEEGAALVIGEMLLFFIPSAVGIMDFFPLLRTHSFHLLGVILCSISFLLLYIAGVPRLFSSPPQPKEEQAS